MTRLRQLDRGAMFLTTSRRIGVVLEHASGSGVGIEVELEARPGSDDVVSVVLHPAVLVRPINPTHNTSFGRSISDVYSLAAPRSRRGAFR